MEFRTIISIGMFFMCFISNAQDIKGTYSIENIGTGLVLRIKDAQKENGTPLVAYTPVNWKCVTWDFQKVEEQTYQLKNLFTGKTFQPNGGKTVSNNHLEQRPLAQNPNQYYQFIPAGNDSYFIRLYGTELYLTPQAPEGRVNSAIILSKKSNDNDLQKWTIYEQRPTM